MMLCEILGDVASFVSRIIPALIPNRAGELLMFLFLHSLPWCDDWMIVHFPSWSLCNNVFVYMLYDTFGATRALDQDRKKTGKMNIVHHQALMTHSLLTARSVLLFQGRVPFQTSAIQYRSPARTMLLSSTIEAGKGATTDDFLLNPVTHQWMKQVYTHVNHAHGCRRFLVITKREKIQLERTSAY